MLRMSTISITIALLVVYLVALVTYRLWFSPVAHIPGPWLARATYWYEFYYDVVLTGRYTFKVKELHEKYGPIIRVNPHEVHIHDADFFDEIFAGASKRRSRWAWQARTFHFDYAMITSIDYDDHRRKRMRWNHYFSKAKTRSLQPRIEAVIFELLAKFDEYKTSGKPLSLIPATFALSNDTIMNYAFGTSYNRIAAHEFDPTFHAHSLAAMRKGHLMKHMPILQWVVRIIPDNFLKQNVPEMAGFLQLQEDIKRQVSETQEELKRKTDKLSCQTIFHELLEGSPLPFKDPFGYLWENGVILVLGGTSTTATVMYIIIFHLLKNQQCLKRLRKELAFIANKNMHPGPDLSIIESLPYLTAVIKEGLRMSGTVTTRLQRINRDKPMVYTDRREMSGKLYTIPLGTPVSSTVLLIHYDPDYYPEPFKFKPERWLAENGNVPPADRHFVPFLKGTTQCIGMNLAWAELYLLFYHMFKPGSYGSHEARTEDDRGLIELFETDYEDIEVIGDGLGPIYRIDSRGVRLRIEPFQSERKADMPRG